MALAGVACLALAIAGPVHASDGVLTAEAWEIAEQIQCPICEGQSIVQSNSDTSRIMRDKVQELLDAGWSEEQILDYFVDSFGIFILRDPPKTGIALGVWLAPPLALLAGLALLYAVYRAWQRQGPRDTEDVEEQDVARVEEEVRRWEGSA